MPKLYQLASLSILGFTISSMASYLFQLNNAITARWISFGVIGLICLIAILLQSEIAKWCGIEEDNIILFVSMFFTSSFCGGALRAIALKREIEGIVLVSIIAAVWLSLLVIVLRAHLGVGQKEQTKEELAIWQ